ncbi:hypothetical protein COL922a_013347, partial [Colletotrichum nupharicola]
SSSSSRNQPQSLAQELASVKDYDMLDLNKQAMNSLNEQLQNARQAYKKLEKDIRGDANLKKVQELQEELNTLQAAANIITTPIIGQQKLKLNTPITYNSTPRQLKLFLI